MSSEYCAPCRIDYRWWRRHHSDMLDPSLRKAFFLFAFVCLTGRAAELARWEASQAGTNAVSIQLEPGPEWRSESVDTRQVARLNPSSDFYTRAGYGFTIPPIAVPDCWVIAEFVDRGYGLISLSPGVPQT